MRIRHLIIAGAAVMLGVAALSRLPLTAQEKSKAEGLKSVLKEQARRVEVVKKITPAVVAVFARGGKGGGSGVLISKDGYALTNYHVVAPAGPVMKCGLSDGHFYDAALVGWDKVGDVALIKLLPKQKGQDFKFSVMGDSNKVREGDWSLAAGNPFLLATDFTPTVTFGMISGVHRYQYPAGTFLEYTDCIQIDTSINPGNSGGPLFNMDGELIGINGRGSFDKRGRVNSGVGYAISINQIKNFMGHLRAGLDCDHASLGAIVTTQTESSGLARLLVTQILEECDAARRGLDYDDELSTFDGRLMTSVNQYLNIIGTYPRGWRVPMEYRRESRTKEILVRLMGKTRRVLSDPANPNRPKGPKINPIPVKPSPASKYYVKKDGFANYYFNNFEKKQLLDEHKKSGDFSKLKGAWKFVGEIRLKRLRSKSDVTIEIGDAKNNASVRMVVGTGVDQFPYELDPIKENQALGELRQPAGSGGFLGAMYVYRRMLLEGAGGFIESVHGGSAPIYPPLASGKAVTQWGKQKQMTDVLTTKFGRFINNWHFSQPDAKNPSRRLLALELRIDEENQDPCEVYFSDYRMVGGRSLPHLIQVRYGDSLYGTITLSKIELPKG